MPNTRIYREERGTFLAFKELVVWSRGKAKKFSLPRGDEPNNGSTVRGSGYKRGAQRGEHNLAELSKRKAL